MYHYHKTMVSISEYSQACADADEPVEIGKVLKCIQGNTARVFPEGTYDNKSVHDYVWKVFGLIETHKRLSVKMDHYSNPAKVVVKVGQNPT